MLRMSKALKAGRVVGLGVFVLLVSLGVLMSGCGGGGGGGAPLTPPSGVFRMLRVGDTWTYDVSGTLTFLTTGIKVNFTGTLRIDIEPTDIEGVLTLKTTTIMKLPDGTTVTSVNRTAFSQDDDGTIYEVGAFLPQGIDLLQTPMVMYQSPMAVGQVVDTSGVYVSGRTVLSSYRVDAVERVSVPAGTWVAFKVTKSGQGRDALGRQISSAQFTEWIVPSLGMFVKHQGTATFYEDGVSYTRTASLRTYQLTP